MTERERFILRAALIYAMANLDHLNESFENYAVNHEEYRIKVNGEGGSPITEDEVESALLVLQ